MNHSNDVMLGLSGGVDSATSAFLLMKQGYKVQPILMHNWQDDVHCSIEADLKDCQNICSHLGLSLEVVNFANSIDKKYLIIVTLQQGLTPNPDILCNRQIKFAALKKPPTLWDIIT